MPVLMSQNTRPLASFLPSTTSKARIWCGAFGSCEAAGIRDIENFLVGREGKPVGLHEILDHGCDLAGLGIDAIDVAAALLLLRPAALELRHDPVAGVGEPDAVVGLHHHIVRRVEPLALVLVGDDGDRAVRLGAGHAPASVLAGDEPALAVAGVAVAVVGLGAEGADAGLRRPAQHAVVGDVAPQQVAAIGEPDRAFRPDAAVRQLVEMRDADHQRLEALVENLVETVIRRHLYPPLQRLGLSPPASVIMAMMIRPVSTRRTPALAP